MLTSRHPFFIPIDMTTRYFTLDEANQALQYIEPLMGQLLEKRARSVRRSRQIEHLLENPHIDFGGALPSELALEFVKEHLKQGGDYVVKLFQGTDFDAYVLDVRSLFEKVQVKKPKASRPRSKEVYLLARGLKVQ